MQLITKLSFSRRRQRHSLNNMSSTGLLERLKAGEDIIVAEGYVFEFERRGYLKAGVFVPEVVLEHPDKVRSLHEEFVHAGNDVVLAFTYYGHREKLKHVGREQDVESLNRKALKIARQVADETGKLMAGNICNTCVYEANNPEAIQTARMMFKEQIEWAVKEGADFIVAETFDEFGEALLALECIKEYGKVPAVVSLIPITVDKTRDGLRFDEACCKLEEAGADVVGLNCCMGPETMLPLIRDIRKKCKGPICMLPIPYRTTCQEPTMLCLRDKKTGEYSPSSRLKSFPVDMPAFACSRTDIKDFAREAKIIGVQYVGICCGNASHYLRVLAEEYGKIPPASRYLPDMSQHYIFGENVKPYTEKKYLTRAST